MGNAPSMLCSAAAAGNTSDVARLLNKGVDPNATDKTMAKRATTALYEAAINGQEATTRQLLQAGADPNLVTARNESALFGAATHGRVEVVPILIEAGADLNAPDQRGTTPLGIAAKLGHTAIVQLLLDAGANVNQKDNYVVVCAMRLSPRTQAGATPLALAASHGHVGAIKALLHASAPIPRSVRYPLLRAPHFTHSQALVKAASVAALGNHTAAVDVLLKVRTQEEQSLQAGDAGQVGQLLAQGANADTISAEGATPLTAAVSLGRTDIVDLLLEAGADIRLRNQEGDNPLICAIKGGHNALAQRLNTLMFTTEMEADLSLLEQDDQAPLGAGAYGVVLRGKYRGQDVAIKLANRQGADDMRSEIDLMISHPSPYIVPLLAVANADSAEPQMILELMDAGDLAQYIKRQRAGEPTLVHYSMFEVAWVVAHALVDLHRRHVLHRDLKSKNVLLCSKNYIKVADLGVSKDLETLMTTMAGTLAWMAPEVLEHGGKYSFPADIYSFGVVLVEMETLAPPYADLELSAFQLVDRVRKGQLAPKPSPTCVPWLRRLIEACVSFDPARRPTAEQIVAILSQHRDAAEVLEPEVSTVSVLFSCMACGAENAVVEHRCGACGHDLPDDKTRLRELTARMTAAGIDTHMACAVCTTVTAGLAEICDFCDEVLPTAAEIIPIFVKRCKLCVPAPGAESTLKLALMPYAQSIASYYASCANDVGVGPYELEAAAKNDPNVALKIVASSNCKKMVQTEQKGMSTISPPCTLEQFKTTMSSAEFAAMSWDDIVANTTAEAKNMSGNSASSYISAPPLQSSYQSVYSPVTTNYAPPLISATVPPAKSHSTLPSAGSFLSSLDHLLPSTLPNAEPKDRASPVTFATPATAARDSDRRPDARDDERNRPFALQSKGTDEVVALALLDDPATYEPGVEGPTAIDILSVIGLQVAGLGLIAVHRGHRPMVQCKYELLYPPVHEVSNSTSVIHDDFTPQANIDKLEMDASRYLGSGAFGVIYAGKCDGRDVAIKRATQQRSATLRSKIALFTKCPYVLPLLAVTGLGTTGAQMILPVMDAGDLHGYFQAKREGGPTIVNYSTLEVAWVMARALWCLHDRHVMHRDLKCNNVGDLGESKDMQTLMTSGVGTIQWTAPEVLVHGGNSTQQPPNADLGLTQCQILDGVAAGTLRPTISNDCTLWKRGLINACLDHYPTLRSTAKEADVRLAQAAKDGNVTDVTRLLDAGLDPNAVDEDGHAPLYLAAAKGHHAAVSVLLHARADINRSDRVGQTPLLIAAWNGHDKVVSVLLQARADVNKGRRDGWTPLHIAAFNGHGAVVNLLLRAKADINRISKVDRTPLHLAAVKGHLRIVSLLLEAHADVNEIDTVGQTPLHIAAWNGHDIVVQLLLRANANVNKSDKAGWTPLYVAAEKGHVPVVTLLLRAGAHVDQRKGDAWTPLHVAACNGYTDVVALLLQAKAEINPTSKAGWTPLHLAAVKGHTTVVALLLQAAADANAVDHEGQTPLHIAAEKGHDAVVALLLQADADVHCKSRLVEAVRQGDLDQVYHSIVQERVSPNTTNASGESILFTAVLSRNAKMTRNLSASGADVNKPDESGRSPLVAAIELDHFPTIITLLQAKADVNQCPPGGMSPLCMAAFHGQEAIASMLLSCGADVNHLGSEGQSPLLLAVTAGHKGLVGMLLVAGANVNLPNAHGCTPLARATLNGDSVLVEMLLAGGADVNCPDKEGRTAVYLAASKGDDPMVDLLLEAHADVTIASHAGDSPLLVAIKHGYRKIAQKLNAIMVAEAPKIELDEIVCLSEPVGRGGQGIVYKGQYKDTAVAIKTVFDREGIPALEIEIENIIKCNSPYIIKLLAAYGLHTNEPKMVLEYMDGGNLRAYLNKKRDGLPVPLEFSTLQLAWVIANAVCDLHEKNLLHRDLKSDNVLLCSKNYIKLADLGISREYDTRTMTSAVGTWHWIAPEVFDGGHYDFSADIYSFGVILTELETYQRPYWNVQLGQMTLIDHVRNGKLRPTLSPKADEWYRQLTEACLRHDPASRPKAREVVKCLEAQIAQSRKFIDRTLLEASGEGNVDRVNQLLDDGANTNHRNKNGQTSLHLAVSSGRDDIATLLLEAHADVAARDENGLEPLHVAAGNGHVEAARVLMKAGAKVNARCVNGSTPLHWAAGYGRPEMVALLLGAEANINAQTIDGDTPLFGADVQGYSYVVAQLLVAGADANIRNNVDESQLVVNKSERLGCGTFSDVYRGTYCDRDVAIKRLRDKNDPHFDREVNLLTRPLFSIELEVSCRQLIAWSSTQLVLERMDAGDLREYLDAKRTGAPTLVNYSMLEVAWAVAHALVDLHGRNVVHRDVKSSNILLSTNNYIKLGDFGTSNDASNTMTSYVGTFAYAAPEVLHNSGRYGVAADIYSYGRTLKELDTLQPPNSKSRNSISTSDHQTSAATDAQLPSAMWMRDLIAACLQTDPCKLTIAALPPLPHLHQ
ncbi:hypothetical protein ACHHYP_10879 [Achlya hypogyna]|uniref:Protein kinase domain-containing protein n=1 Tax=Achlya hypogyna TaxID=1202772 RepID=A0A1V9YKG2_ACHHY|nr:hypothetical protein ACHHYP_10879 [Achlya hypogyna]